MAETKVHFLNVKQGDCFLIERASDRLTAIDICAGNMKEEVLEEKMAALRAAKPRGNYAMCAKPTNPVRYLEQEGLKEVWRFILTHPDMDHMDGIKELFETKIVKHFWDCGIRREKPDFEKGGPYLEEDWDFYADLIAGKIDGTSVVTPRAGDGGKYWNADDDEGNGDGDYLSIVSPNETLLASANDDGDINDASYVIVYRSCAGRIIFAGDSNDRTWEYILEKHESLVSDAAVLFAPHHGRKSDRSYSFLDVVKPRVSFFGCAPSGHLAYSAWQYRNLLYFTNNQCGNVHIYPNGEVVDVFIQNETYARDYTKNSTYQKNGYWFLCKE